MDRRLVLLRHARSAWNVGTLVDHERPLNGRGRQDAPRVGVGLVDAGWVPDLVVCSDATRAVETWERMRGVFPSGVPCEYTGALYHAGMGALRGVLSELPPRLRSVLAVGHNPGWEEAVRWLSGEAVELTTGNAALLEGRGEGWAQALAEPGSWRLVDVLRPRDLTTS